MRAVLQHRYGTAEVLQLGRVPRPVIGDHDVLVEVHAAGLDRGTEHLITGKPYAMRLAFGLTRPRNPVPGRDVAGTVVAIGAAVTRFAVGDQVYGVAPGSFQVVAQESRLALKPAPLLHPNNAVVPVSADICATGTRRRGRVQVGQRPLVRPARRRGSNAVSSSRRSGPDRAEHRWTGHLITGKPYAMRGSRSASRARKPVPGRDVRRHRRRDRRGGHPVRCR